MTFTGQIVWEARTTGSDTNGGGFKLNGAGSDYSQQNSPQYSGTDLEINSANNLQVKSTTAGSPVAADVGNLIMISNGLSWSLGWYEIVSQDGTWWTLDASPGAAGLTGGHFAVGGALASPGVGWAVSHNKGTGNYRGFVWIQSGTYGITNSSTSGGVPSSGCLLYYYRSSGQRYDPALGRGPKPSSNPVLQSQSGYTGRAAEINYSGSVSYATGGLMYLDFDTNGLCTTSNYIQNPAEVYYCNVSGSSTQNLVGGGSWYFCDITATSLPSGRSVVYGGSYKNCHIRLSSGNRAVIATSASCDNCVLVSYGTGGFQYWAIRIDRHGKFTNNRIYVSGQAAIYNLGQHEIFINNIVVGDGTQDFWRTSGGTAPTGDWNNVKCYNNYYYGLNDSTLAGVNAVPDGAGRLEDPIALSQDPFVDSAGGDFTLDSTGADYATVLSGNITEQAVPNTTVGPRLSTFTEGTSGGTSYTPAASAKFTRLE